MSPFVVVLYAQGKSGEEIKAACGMAGSSVRVVTMEELAALGASPSAQVWLFFLPYFFFKSNVCTVLLLLSGIYLCVSVRTLS